MFQIAATIGYGYDHGYDYIFPDWEHSHIYKHKIPIMPSIVYKLQFNEFEIQEWRRDDIGKSYTHFAYVRRSGEIVDTLGNSVTLAKGYLVSRRVFKLLPK